MSDSPRKSSYWRKVRKRVLLEGSGSCGLCGQYVDVQAPSHQPHSPEVDHIIPLSLGGDPFDRSNLQLTHKACNQLKGYNNSKKQRKSVVENTRVESTNVDEVDNREDFDWGDSNE